MDQWLAARLTHTVDPDHLEEPDLSDALVVGPSCDGEHALVTRNVALKMSPSSPFSFEDFFLFVIVINSNTR